MVRLKDLGELELIEKIRGLVGQPTERVVVGLGDDAALVTAGTGLLSVLTTDSVVEDVHFRMALIDPVDLGYKALAAAVSDIAAMAGRPRYAVVSLALNGETTLAFVEALYSGFRSGADTFGLDLVGGDTSASEKAVINVTVLGEVAPDRYCLRSAAKPGDTLAVSGSLGAAAAGLELTLHPDVSVSPGDRARLIKAHHRPRPRVKEAATAAASGVRAIEDISDGLATEVFHLCTESKTGAEVWEKRLPLAPGVADVALALERTPGQMALFGGEDYELVMAVPEGKFDYVRGRVFEETGTDLTEVGKILGPESGIAVVDVDGGVQPLAPRGYEHFSS